MVLMGLGKCFSNVGMCTECTPRDKHSHYRGNLSGNGNIYFTLMVNDKTLTNVCERALP